ncbi:MAG: DUF1850 domain-containing protein [Betaproteobacteria bacterium]|nr:DUF1850 domain-containing protein [Betaproteobacteria bacterium]
MTRPRGRRLRPVPAALSALLGCVVVAASAAGSCLTVSAVDGTLLAAQPLAAGEAGFALRYVHSVTRTPVEERYRVDGAALVQTELRFAEHGPGLPTAAADGEAWSREGDQFVVRMTRPLDGIRARVDPAQSPRLATATSDVDLAQWGARPVVVGARPGACPAP